MDAANHVPVYFFRGRAAETGQTSYGWLRHANLSPQFDFTHKDEDGIYGTTITLPEAELSTFRKLQKQCPQRYGNDPAIWITDDRDRPDRIPENGLYWFRAHPTDQRRICEVTNTRVRFRCNPNGILHEFLGHAVIFEPLTLEEFPQEPSRAIYITIDHKAEIGIIHPPGEPLPTPKELLDTYSREYGIQRDILGWGTLRFIPMPNIPGYNIPGYNIPHPEESTA